MGFDRTRVVRALKRYPAQEARAVEYLLEGGADTETEAPRSSAAASSSTSASLGPRKDPVKAASSLPPSEDFEVADFSGLLCDEDPSAAFEADYTPIVSETTPKAQPPATPAAPKEPVKETVKEPVKEPAKEPVKETVKESVKEVKEAAKEPAPAPAVSSAPTPAPAAVDKKGMFPSTLPHSLISKNNFCRRERERTSKGLHCICCYCFSCCRSSRRTCYPDRTPTPLCPYASLVSSFDFPSHLSPYRYAVLRYKRCLDRSTHSIVRLGRPRELCTT
jgi:hypothetical protein